MNETNKWIRVQKHPILKCGAITIENKQVNVMALFRNGHSTIMVCYDKESEYALEERMIGLTGNLLSIFQERY